MLLFYFGLIRTIQYILLFSNQADAELANIQAIQAIIVLFDEDEVYNGYITEVQQWTVLGHSWHILSQASKLWLFLGYALRLVQ